MSGLISEPLAPGDKQLETAGHCSDCRGPSSGADVMGE